MQIHAEFKHSVLVELVSIFLLLFASSILMPRDFNMCLIGQRDSAHPLAAWVLQPLHVSYYVHVQYFGRAGMEAAPSLGAGSSPPFLLWTDQVQSCHCRWPPKHHAVLARSLHWYRMAR